MTTPIMRSSLSQIGFTPNPQGMAELIRSTSGPVFRDLLRRGDMLIRHAKAQVGYDDAPERGPVGPSTAGGREQPHLRDTIVKRTDLSDSRGPKLLVGSDAGPKALVHHEGSQPHVIVPRTAQMLRFVSSSGEVVFARRVQHPGTRPNRYLTDNLPKVVN